MFTLVAGPVWSGEKGFRFTGGDVARGKEAFVRLNCVQCHRVNAVELSGPRGERRLDLTLAGETRFVRNYESLVTAITNPQHVVNEQYRALLSEAGVQGDIQAFMPDLTEEMSVRQLVDLVTFLDKVYRESRDDYGKE